MKLPVASHTFLNDWDNCPHKAFRKFIKKDLPRGEQTQAMKWGIQVHEAFEARLKHDRPFPPEMVRYEWIAAPLKAAGAGAELALAIKEDGTLCDFWDSKAWLRGKLDAPVINWPNGAIFDFKTGKRREEPDELHIHAILLKAFRPTMQRVTGFYVWLGDNEVGRAHDVSDTESKLAEIRQTMATVQNCIEIEDFPKRRNPLCGYCPVTDCEFNRSQS